MVREPMHSAEEISVPALPRGAVGHWPTHYSATARHLPYHPPAGGRSSCDVCVIGGGLAGITTALLLARRGRKVTLLEANRLAWAASGRNGGFVAAGFAEPIFEIERRIGLDHARELFRLSVEGVGIVRKLAREAPQAERIIEGNGYLRLTRHGDATALERTGERMARDYAHLQTFMSRREVTALVESRRYTAGLMDMNAFHLHPLEYANHAARLAEHAGAALHENSTVVGFSRLRSGGFDVRTREASIDAGAVVIATNANRGPVPKVNAAVIPVATFVAAATSARLSDAIRFAGCISDTRIANDYYRIVRAEGRPVLIWGGGMSALNPDPGNLRERMRRSILSVFPQLHDLTITRAWPGIMGYSVHKMPLIGRIEEGLYVATAFGGHGLNTTAMAAQLVCEAICDGSERYRAFSPFEMRNSGGYAGRLAAQLEYWRLGLSERIAEARVTTGR
jgi:gamma-glutamylputrescine oxidase